MAEIVAGGGEFLRGRDDVDGPAVFAFGLHQRHAEGALGAAVFRRAGRRRFDKTHRKFVGIDLVGLGAVRAAGLHAVVEHGTKGARIVLEGSAGDDADFGFFHGLAGLGNGFRRAGRGEQVGAGVGRQPEIHGVEQPEHAEVRFAFWPGDRVGRRVRRADRKEFDFQAAALGERQVGSDERHFAVGGNQALDDAGRGLRAFLVVDPFGAEDVVVGGIGGAVVRGEDNVAFDPPADHLGGADFGNVPDWPVKAERGHFAFDDHDLVGRGRAFRRSGDDDHDHRAELDEARIVLAENRLAEPHERAEAAAWRAFGVAFGDLHDGPLLELRPACGRKSTRRGDVAFQRGGRGGAFPVERHRLGQFGFQGAEVRERSES